MVSLILTVYAVSLTVLLLYGLHSLVLLAFYHRGRRQPSVRPPEPVDWPVVTVQLPIFNELHVAERLVTAVAALDYPADRLEIQVLDDSTDETVERVAAHVAALRAAGCDVHHLRRIERTGYKAGALRAGLEQARGELIAIFDADFVPPTDFLRRLVPHLTATPSVGMVQARWSHLNGDYSALTRAQAIALDAHFVIEQNGRDRAGCFLNFNGTAGLWRRSCIEDAGNWQADTLTEDLDLSYRAQLRGWRFRFVGDVVAPAELPAEVGALKSQQFRWTKGAVETARKLLPRLWRTPGLPFWLKAMATMHLTSNLVFPFILLAGILNVPLIWIKHAGGHSVYFAATSVGLVTFLGSLVVYATAQRAIYPDWRRRLLWLPVFLAGSMGLTVVNTRAVVSALLGRRSPFIRTPKYRLEGKTDRWQHKRYAASGRDRTFWVEALLTIYCAAGLGLAVALAEYAAIPFLLLFGGGFATLTLLALRRSAL